MRSGKGWILAPLSLVTEVHCMQLSSPGLALPSDQVLSHCFKPWQHFWQTESAKMKIGFLSFNFSRVSPQWGRSSACPTAGRRTFGNHQSLHRGLHISVFWNRSHPVTHHLNKKMFGLVLKKQLDGYFAAILLRQHWMKQYSLPARCLCLCPHSL